MACDVAKRGIKELLMGSRVLVVDDSAFMRRAISDVLEHNGHTVIGRARNGREGVEMATELKPDVVTLDVEMPEMDGLTALPRILRACDAHVIMVSSLTTDGSREAIRALHAGASEIVAKSHSQFAVDLDSLGEELSRKVAGLSTPRVKTTTRMDPSRVLSIPKKVHDSIRRCDLVAIGSSTGGPPALEAVLKALPEGFAPPVVVAQHMPAMFTESLAERLDEMCALNVLHAEHRMPVRPGFVYITPGGKHLRVLGGASGYRLEVSTIPTEALYKPSVNELFGSVAKVAGRRAVGVILTGMGDDGTIGGHAMHDAGSVILGQSYETCVVYGMPKSASEAGIVDAECSPSEIGVELAQHGQKVRAAA